MSRGKSDFCYYFDASVYLAHYLPMLDNPGLVIKRAILEAMEQNKRGGCDIITSSITMAEVDAQLLRYKCLSEINDLNNKFNCSLHRAIDADLKISEKAAEYRDYYRLHPVTSPHGQESSNLTMFDAIHLATAKLYECDELWTLDGFGAKMDRWKSVKMLWLKNRVAGEPLTIVAPYSSSARQAELPLPPGSSGNRLTGSN
jgi:predicted nucleic acid-binding protein